MKNRVMQICSDDSEAFVGRYVLISATERPVRAEGELERMADNRCTYRVENTACHKNCMTLCTIVTFP